MCGSQNINDLFVQAFAIQYSVTALCPEVCATRVALDSQRSLRPGRGPQDLTMLILYVMEEKPNEAAFVLFANEKELIFPIKKAFIFQTNL